MKLTNKVSLVTGGGQGIGAAIASAFSQQGVAVMIADRNAETAAKMVAEIEEQGGQAAYVVGDVGEKEDCECMAAETVGRFGRIDILAHSAGVGFHRLFLETALEDWERVLRINLTGTFLIGQAVVTHMIKQGGGRIINIGSITGQRGSISRSAYGASKAGMMNLTKVMAVELAEKGIIVNAIAPGPIKTPLSNHGPDQTRAYLERIPMKKYGVPESVAAAAVYLASDDCAFVTGHILNVDGGYGQGNRSMSIVQRELI